MERIERLPGLAVVYNDSASDGIPLLFKRLVDSWGVHDVVVFATVRQVTKKQRAGMGASPGPPPWQAFKRSGRSEPWEAGRRKS